MQNSKLQFKIQNLNPKLKTFHFSLFTFNSEGGQSLVEILLTIGLSAILLPALLVGLVASREGKAQQAQRTQAVYLLNEAADAIRSVRERGWTNYIATVPLNAPYHPEISGSIWSLADGEYTDPVTGFKTRAEFSNVNRGVCPGADCGKIVTSGGILDPSSRKVTVTISWILPYASSISDTLYIARYLENNSFTQTTVADFDAGIKSGTTITNLSGGEIVLAAGGGGDWCNPNLSIASLDLPKSGVANAVSAIEGKAFVGTGDNASGISYSSVSISNTDPPAATVSGTFDGYKTNDGIFGETNYAYLATDTNSKEVVIVDLRNPADGKYSEAGYFNAPGNGNGLSVAVSGNIGFMTTGVNKLYTFDLSSKTGSRPQLGEITLTGTGNRIVVLGNYVYVAVSGAIQFQIIQVSSDGRTLSFIGGASLPGLDGKGVAVNSTATRAYIATANSPTQGELFIVDISTKTGMKPALGAYDSNGTNPKGVVIVPGNRAILVGIGAQEYQIINIQDETNPINCGGLNIDSGINGVSSVIESDGAAYSYIITGDATSEFKIIEGGPGGQYASSGEFVSGAFDAGFSTAFNRFDVSVNRPSSTDIKLQTAVSQAVAGDCSGASYNFVGPDATPASFFTTSETVGIQTFSFPVPIILNPGRCFEYKLYFSSADFMASPIFYDITTNYSP